MSESEEKGDSIEHHISGVSKDPNYKVLTKEEYEVLWNASVKKEHKTSTPFGALLNVALNDKAKSMLVSVGDKAPLEDIMKKLDGFFG